jgi:hypothetical protein
MIARVSSKTTVIILCLLCACGCVRLFGWDIHAPGLLSESFYTDIQPCDRRVALYLTEKTRTYISKNKGGRLADPQTYYIGEAFEPMAVEAFAAQFSECIYCEIEPTDLLLKRYDISYLIVIDIIGFDNKVGLKGQAVSLKTNVYIFDTNMRLCARFISEGASDAQKVFAKRGGPEVNLNAAIEKNIAGTIEFLHDILPEKEEPR